MNIFNKSIALCLTALSFANIQAIDKELDADVHEVQVEEVSYAPRVRRGVLTSTRRVNSEIAKAQRSTRKALKRYLSAATSCAYGTSLRTQQKAFEQAAQNYCDLLTDIAEQVKTGSLVLTSFTTLNGFEMVMVKGSKPSIFAPAAVGTGLGFGTGALIGGSLAYIYESLAFTFGLTIVPAYIATGLAVGTVGGLLGGACGLLGSFCGQPTINEEALEDAEEFAEIIGEKIMRAEDALIAQLR